MVNVVITGGSKGVGLALAKKFISLGDSVVISSRSLENLSKAKNSVRDTNQLYTFQADVTKYEAVDSLVTYSKEVLGAIDIWINNAGIDSEDHVDFSNYNIETIRRIVETNLLGTLYCTRAVLPILINQNSGKIFNIDGLGSNGRVTRGYLPYSTTKRAIPMIAKGLTLELKNSGVGVHTASPGMVLTDLLLTGSNNRTKKIFNILAEKPSTIADFLVPRMKSVSGSNKYIKFLTQKKATFRFLTAWRYKNRFFDKNGNLLVNLDE